MRAGRRRLLIAAGTVLLIDAGTKVYAANSLGQPVEIGASLSLRLSHNSGVAFGLGGSSPVGLILTLTALLTATLAWAGWTDRLRPPVAVGLVFGGAIGNLLDRLVGGSVVDMIHLTWWPTFNMADVAICAGALGIVLASLRPEKDRGEPAHQSVAQAEGRR